MSTRDDILSKTDGGRTIYQQILRKPIKKGLYLSPIREEKNPSFSLFQDRGEWKWKDHGSDQSGDVFDLLRYFHNEDDFKKLLEIADKDYCGGTDSIENKIIRSNNRQIDNKFKYRAFSKFTPSGRKYWESYNITPDQLEKYRVIQLEDYQFNGYQYTHSEKDLAFAYLVGKHLKIYRPFAEKGPKFIWPMSKPENFIFGYDKLPQSGETVFITGGEKDVMSLDSQDYPAITFNSEVAKPPNENIIPELKGRFKQVVILYDIDDTGKKNGKRLAEDYNLKRLELPTGLVEFTHPLTGKQCKDIADFFSFDITTPNREGFFTQKQHFEALIAESTEDEIDKIINESRISIYDNFPPPEIAWGFRKEINALETKRFIVGTLGNFTCIHGKAKSRKSFFIAAIVGGILQYQKSSQSYFNLYSQLKNKKILYFDTEQGPWHCSKVIERIFKISRLDKEEFDQKIVFHRLRNYSTKKRIEVIERLINKNSKDIGIVVIDGVRDIAFDINSPLEATEMEERLLAWTGIYNIHLITVIHQNKGDNNMRGHLGTELLNKCEAAIEVCRDPHNKMISNVNPTDVRELDFEPFAFQINQDEIPEILEDRVIDSHSKANRNDISPEDYPDQVHKEILIEIFQNQQDLSQNKLMPFVKVAIGNRGSKISDRNARDFIAFYELKNWIVNNGEERNGIAKKLNINREISTNLPI